MPSRRRFLRRVGGVAALGTFTVSAGCLGAGVVRTKAGGGFGDIIDLDSPDDETFVPPAEFAAYVDRTRERYGDAAVPWTDPASRTGEFVGAYARQVDIVPDDRFAVQDAAVLVHRLDDARSKYRLRLWSAGRLLGRKYEVDPWGYYREETAFTRLAHELEVERDAQLSANRSVSTDGGPVDAGGATATVPDGSYEMGPAGDARYRATWDGFHAGTIPLVGVCDASFADGADRHLDWTISNGVGVRTPF